MGASRVLVRWIKIHCRRSWGLDKLEGRIYRALFHAVDDHRTLILDRYPGPDVLRRNTGYALDVLARGRPWAAGGPQFNLAPFLCGSEGTLAIITEAVLNLVTKPLSRLLVCAHFDSLDGALRATLVGVCHQPAAVELIDRRILELTRGHLEQRHNRFWIEGDPEAVLIIELSGADTKELAQRASDLVNDLQCIGLGYAFPLVGPPRMSQVWELRAAGLGLLMGAQGDVKTVTVIEDTAVAVAELPEYVHRIQALMDKFQTRCVYYGHASVGLLHLRPELNLKQPEGIEKFKALAAEVADLVAEFGGSLFRSVRASCVRLRGSLTDPSLGFIPTRRKAQRFWVWSLRRSSPSAMKRRIWWRVACARRLGPLRNGPCSSRNSWPGRRGQASSAR